MTNVHHLELFYYVARHGGISAAVRQIPYGIQQPAVSGQMRALEDELGVRLFERSPFRLTPAGERLYVYVQPFFERLDIVARRLRTRTSPQLRIAASEVVLLYHLPNVLRAMQAEHPQVRLGLRSGFDTDLAAWLSGGHVDLTISPLAGRPPPRTASLRLLRLPLALLVPKKWKQKSAAELWTGRRPAEPLISMPARESVSLVFQRGLRKRAVDWPVAIEASSLDMITQYVADGRGAGVSVWMAEFMKHPGVKALPLEGFEQLEVAALWHGEPSPLVRAVLTEGVRYVRTTWPAFACPDDLPAAEAETSRNRG